MSEPAGLPPGTASVLESEAYTPLRTTATTYRTIDVIFAFFILLSIAQFSVPASTSILQLLAAVLATSRVIG